MSNKSPADESYCPYCRAPRDMGHWKRHVESCVHNPAVSERTIAFLRENAMGGIIMSSELYSKSIIGKSLPSRNILDEYIGTWSDVAQWAGLKERIRRAEKECAVVAPDKPQHVAAWDAYPEGISAYRALRLIRAWQPQTKMYVPHHWQIVCVIK